MSRIWDLKMRNLSCQRIFQANAPVNCAVLHPNQQELVVGDQSGVIHIWNLQNDQSEQLIPEQDASIQHIDIDKQGRYTVRGTGIRRQRQLLTFVSYVQAAVNNKGNCYVWSLSAPGLKESTTLQPKKWFCAHKRYVLCCKFSPDGAILATSSADHSVRLWSTDDFTKVQVEQVLNDISKLCTLKYRFRVTLSQCRISHASPRGGCGT